MRAFHTFKEKHRIQSEKIMGLKAESMLLLFNAPDTGQDLATFFSEIAKSKKGFDELLNTSIDGSILVYAAASSGYASVIAEIGKLENGFELLNTSSNGMTPAYAAASNGHAAGKGHASVIAEIAKSKKGFELLSIPISGLGTPAYIAAREGHASVIAEIAKLDKGFELLNTPNSHGSTPLSIAVENGKINVIEAIASLAKGPELLKTINTDKLSALPSIIIKKCAVKIFLKEINNLSEHTSMNDDRKNFIEEQLEKLSEANDFQTVDDMLEKLKNHLLVLKEIDKCIKKLREKTLIWPKRKIEKANNIENALKEIPMDQRDSILLQNTEAKKKLCKELALRVHSWDLRKGKEINKEGVIIEKNAAKSFTQFKQAIQNMKKEKHDLSNESLMPIRSKLKK